MSKKIGITGGIGSGKTTVCKIFETLGVPVYYADDRAKALMVNNSELVQQIVALFGSEAYLPTGELNRAHLAAIVFQDKKKLEQLNALVHPAVWKDGDRWHEQQQSSYTLKEAALLFESGGDQFLDAIITVTAPETLRIQRVVQRDGASIEQVQARIKQQWPEEQKVERSDYIIYNDGEQSLIPQVLRIHRAILRQSQINGSE